MNCSEYRISKPVTVVILHAGHYRLTQLPAGSVFQTASPKPDRNGMIDGTCGGYAAIIFSRDLQDCAVPISAEPPLVSSINA